MRFALTQLEISLSWGTRAWQTAVPKHMFSHFGALRLCPKRGLSLSLTLLLSRSSGGCPNGLVPYGGAASPAAQVFALRQSGEEGVAVDSSGVGC